MIEKRAKAGVKKNLKKVGLPFFLFPFFLFALFPILVLFEHHFLYSPPRTGW